MKITALKTFVVPTTGNFIVEVETDEGNHGLGEAGLKLRGTAIAAVIRSFSRDAIGQDPFRFEQTRAYMDRCAATDGHLVIFDRTAGKSWDEKIFRREEHIGDTAITVWGMSRVK